VILAEKNVWGGILKRIAEDCDSGHKGLNIGINLVNGLVSFASGSVDKRTNADIDKLIITIANIFSRKITNNRISFIFSPSGEEKILYCNHGEIQQVMLNLISNSIDAVCGNKFKKITVTTNKDNDHIILKIKDNGSGIKDEDINHIFDEFFTTKKKGHGIGLSTTKRIIEKHNGEIKVTSQPDIGTEFIIYLPVI